jgi:hypothetical protein
MMHRTTRTGAGDVMEFVVGADPAASEAVRDRRKDSAFPMRSIAAAFWIWRNFIDHQGWKIC